MSKRGHRTPSRSGIVLRGVGWGVLAGAYAVVVAFPISAVRTPVYEATATLIISGRNPIRPPWGPALVTSSPLAIETYRGIMASRVTVEDALRADALGDVPDRRAVRDLQRALTVTAEDAGVSAFLRVAVRHVDPVYAQRMANGIAHVGVQWDTMRAARTLESIITGLDARIAGLDEEIERRSSADVANLEGARADLVVQRAAARAWWNGAVGRLSWLEPAAVPVVPISPRPRRDAGVAGVMAALAAFGSTLAGGMRTAAGDRRRG
jgi:uncharacterized protein involved in exopolysaccharide biosynthesis